MEPDNFKNFRSYTVNFNQSLQPYYYSKVERDPVQLEMQRLDNLEEIIQQCGTDWIVAYCQALWKNNSQQ